MRLVKRLSPQEAADIALKHRLYVSGWNLSGTLKFVRKHNSCCKIILAYEDGIPVGVAVREAYNAPIQVFVKKAFRRQKIGTKLVEAIKEELGKIQGCYGSEASIPFYKTFGMDVR